MLTTRKEVFYSNIQHLQEIMYVLIFSRLIAFKKNIDCLRSLQLIGSFYGNIGKTGLSRLPVFHYDYPSHHPRRLILIIMLTIFSYKRETGEALLNWKD